MTAIIQGASASCLNDPCQSLVTDALETIARVEMAGKQGKINPDLLRERQKCTFDTKELTYLIEGGKEKYLERKEREQLLLSIPGLKYDVPLEYLSHKEKYEEAIRKSCILFKTIRELQDEGKAGVDSYREVLGAQIGSAVLQDGNPLGLHYVMFIPTLMGQGNMEQQAEWIQRSWQLEIIGTYAQTELGHGTFIRGLETTATYDPNKEEFELNSPTLTSYKWWPGGLGHTANYAVVMAQLYTKGVCHGIHPFIVQLRDEDTHMPMPGIKIGEIGSKLGMNTTNNGYLGFEKVRIPRKNMLMRHNKVLKDGTYIKAPSSKLTYGTMIFVRVVIVQDAASYLKKAVTIATRYSAVRHQSQIKEGDGEPQIIDFVTQQHKLFPNIATYFALTFSSTWLWDKYNQYLGDMESGQFDGLPEVHALACCLKAVAAADCTNGVEMCRLACGGHGYMTSSNLPTMYGLVTPMCTYEGENTVLHLQTARYLIKEYQGMLEGKQLTPTLKYLETLRSTMTKPFTRSVEWIISAMQKSAASKIRLAYDNIQSRVRKGIEYEYAWNETSIELAAASEAHCRAVVTEIFYNKVMSIRSKISEPLYKVLFELLQLYAVHTALKVSGDLLRFTSILPGDISKLQSWLEELLTALRPNAVGIVDSFEISDEVLNSTLGAYDGNVYERLFEEANKSPLNHEPVNQSFHKYLKPFLKSKM